MPILCAFKSRLCSQTGKRYLSLSLSPPFPDIPIRNLPLPSALFARLFGKEGTGTSVGAPRTPEVAFSVPLPCAIKRRNAEEGNRRLRRDQSVFRNKEHGRSKPRSAARHPAHFAAHGSTSRYIITRGLPFPTNTTNATQPPKWVNFSFALNRNPPKTRAIGRRKRMWNSGGNKR